MLKTAAAEQNGQKNQSDRSYDDDDDAVDSATMHKRTFSAYNRKHHESKKRRASHKRTLSTYNRNQQVAKMRRCLSLGTVPYREMPDGGDLADIARQLRNRGFVEDEEYDDEGRRQLVAEGKVVRRPSR